MEVKIHKTFWTSSPGGSIDSKEEIADIPDEPKRRQEELNRIVGGIAVTEFRRGRTIAYNVDADFFHLPWNQWAFSKGISVKGTVVEL